MKYVVVLYDGMADYPVDVLNNKTPMEVAKKPNLDKLARFGKMGIVKTVGEGLKPGSDIANMSVLGYNPRECYTGRSPLEAVSIGVDMKDTDIIFRCNLVTLSDEENYEDKTMVDYSAGDISTKEAREIIKDVEKHFGNDVFKFYGGVAYRHCLVWNNGTLDLGKMTPPHDISGKVIKEHLSTSPNAQELINAAEEAELYTEDSFSKQVLSLAIENITQLNSVISEFAKGWKIERLSKVSLAALRLALTEIIYFDDIPSSVSVNEAVELIKKYASEQDASFANGILGSYLRSL